MPHHHAASSSDGTVAILQLVLARCPSTVVNMEARDGWRHGYTALQLAVEKGSLETVKFLVGAGADVRRPCVLVDGEARRLSEVAASKHPHHAALMIGWIDD